MGTLKEFRSAFPPGWEVRPVGGEDGRKPTEYSVYLPNGEHVMRVPVEIVEVDPVGLAARVMIAEGTKTCRRLFGVDFGHREAMAPEDLPQKPKFDRETFEAQHGRRELPGVEAAYELAMEQARRKMREVAAEVRRERGMCPQAPYCPLCRWGTAEGCPSLRTPEDLPKPPTEPENGGGFEFL